MRRRHKAGLAVAAVLATLALAHTAIWWWAVHRIEAGIPDTVAAARTYGWELAGDPPVAGGWPLVARVSIGNLVATRPFGAATLQLRVEHAELELRPGDPAALILLPRGAATVGVGDAAPATLRASRAEFRFPFDAGPFTCRVEALGITGPDGRGARLAGLQGRFGPVDAEATADGVQAIPGFAAPFDAGGRLSIRAAWSPPFPLAATPAASAAAWQAGGGRVTVPAASLEWGTARLAAHAEGELDAALQPRASGEVTMAGLPELLEAATQAGVIPASAGQAARAVLRLLLLSSGGATARLPVALADGTLTVARFPLARLPPLDWQAR